MVFLFTHIDNDNDNTNRAMQVLYKYSVDRLINRLFNDTTMRNLYDSNSAIEKLLVQSQ